MNRRVPSRDPAETETHLREFARATGMALRRLGDGRWRLRGGQLLSVHPATLPLWIEVVREGDAATLTADGLALPWAREKLARVAEHHLVALEDHLTARARLRDAPPRLWLAAAADSFSSRAAAFSWSVLAAVVSLASAFAVTTLLGLVMVQDRVESLGARADLVEHVGYLPLPSKTELQELGFGGRLAAAMVFAVPVSFFFGTVMAVAMALVERVRRLSALPMWMAVYCAGMGIWALWPLASPLVAVPCSILIPLASYAGYTLVWGRRREAKREREPVASRAWIAAGLAVVALVVALRWRAGEAIPRSIAESRDQLLLGHGPGRRLAELYYRYNLYSADYQWAPMDRQLRVAQVRAEPTVIDALTYFEIIPSTLGEVDGPFDFVVESEGERGMIDGAHPFDATPEVRGRTVRLEGVPNDVVRAEMEALDLRVAEDGEFEMVSDATGGTIDGWRFQPPSLSLGRAVFGAGVVRNLRPALEAASRDAFRGSGFREVVSAGFLLVHYAAPLWVLAAAVAPLMVALAWAHLRWRRKGVLGVCAVVCFGATGATMALVAGQSEALAALGEISRGERLVEHAASEQPVVAYRALYALWRELETEDAPAGTAEVAGRQMSHEDVRVRKWAAAVFGRAGLDPLLLIDMLRDESIHVRYQAAGALGDLGTRLRGTDTSAIENALVEAMRNDSWYVGRYALDALRRIRPPLGPTAQSGR